MDQQFELHAEARTAHGTAHSRRLRRTGRLPAVVYGAGEPVAPITLDHNRTLQQLRHEAFKSHVLTLHLDGKTQDVVLRDVHFHPVRVEVLHLDLQRVSATQTLRMEVPLHFIGADRAPGVKLHGGLLSHLMTSVEVECLARDLPEYIEVDVSGMNLEDSIHLADLVLPAAVTLPSLALGPDHNLPVVALHAPRTSAEDEEPAAAAPTPDSTPTPPAEAG